MRDRLNLPIEFDKTRNGYFYNRRSQRVSDDADHRGRNLRARRRGKSLAAVSRHEFRETAFERDRKNGTGAARYHFAEPRRHRTHDFLPHARRADSQSGNFDALAKAVAQRQQLETALSQARPADGKNASWDAYHLANINGEWYLFAYDHARKDLRTFVPARIQSIQPTGKNFERAQKFSLGKNGCATVLASIPAKVNLKLSSVSIRAPPITSAKKNGIRRRPCAI